MPDNNTPFDSILTDTFLDLEMTKLVEAATPEELQEALDIYTGRGFRPPTPSIADGHVDRHEATNTHDSYREFVNRYEIDTEAMEAELQAISEYLLNNPNKEPRRDSDTDPDTNQRMESIPALLYYPIVGPINRGPLPTKNQYLGRITAIDDTPGDDTPRDGPALTFTELHACRLGTPEETVIAAEASETTTLPARTFKHIWIATRQP